MKKRMTCTVVGLAAVLLSAPGALAGQGTQQPTEFEGQLLEVDLTTMTIVVGDAEGGQSMTLAYSRDTEVVGSIDDVRGLNGQAGARLRIQYEVQAESNVATRIEVISLPNEDR